MNLITSEPETFRTRWNALVGFWVARANSEGITWCQRDSQHSAVRQSVLIGCTQSKLSFGRAIMQMQGACFCIASCCCKWCKFLSLSEEIEFVAANARSPVKLPKLLICTYGVCSGEILQSGMNCVVHGYWKSVLVNLFPWVWWINLVCGNRWCDANWPKTIVLTLTYCVVGSDTHTPKTFFRLWAHPLCGLQPIYKEWTVRRRSDTAELERETAASYAKEKNSMLSDRWQRQSLLEDSDPSSESEIPVGQA